MEPDISTVFDLTLDALVLAVIRFVLLSYSQSYEMRKDYHHIV